MIVEKSDLYFDTVKSPLNFTFMIFLFHYLFFWSPNLEKINNFDEFIDQRNLYMRLQAQ